MIYEYALEPEMVAQWGSRDNCRFFSREFKIGQGRLVSCYPKRWPKKVWEAFSGNSDMEKKRLEVLLSSIKMIMVKRKNIYWDEKRISWIENAQYENERYPFYAIIDRNNQEKIITDIGARDFVNDKWDIRHGISVKRNPEELRKYLFPMLSVCKWVKFIDPYLSPGSPNYVPNLKLFFDILGTDRPVGEPQSIEIHTRKSEATREFLHENFEKIIPSGIKAVLYQWKERIGGQKLHNRYILTDFGGISIQHGLDTGREGETDDINRLEFEQYDLRCNQYNPNNSAFDFAEEPLTIIGKFLRK